MAAPLEGWPDLFVEIAPGDTPLTVDPTWVDVTDLVAWELTCTRGRMGSGSRASAGSMTVTFDDPLRVLDGTNTASDHYPYIRPRLPVRFRSVLEYTDIYVDEYTDSYSADVEHPIWRGHLTTPEHSYAPDGDDTSRFECVDLFAVMATVDTSERSAWASTIEGYGPLGWWRLGEATPVDNNTATDDMGRFHGRYAGTSTTIDGLVDDDRSPGIDLGETGQVQIDRNVITAGGSEHTLLFRFKCPTATAGDQTLLALAVPFEVVIASPPGEFTLYIEATTGVLTFATGDEDEFFYTLTGDPVGDNEAHTVAITFTATTRRLYLDGVLQDERTATAGDSPFSKTSVVDGDPAALWVGTVDGFNTDHADDTTIDEIVLLPGELTAGQLLDLHEAAESSWAGETTGDRVARAADLAGIPAGLQNIADGISTVVGWDGGRSTIDVAQEANETEQGILVVSADGLLTFENRHEHLADDPAATFGDTGTDLTYCGHRTEQGEHLIVNRALFTSPAGSGFAEDTTSIDVYGVHSAGGRRTTIDDNQANLVAGAQYLIAQHNGPEQRIVGLEIDPMFDPDLLWPQVLGRDIGDRLIVNRTPQYGDPISQEVVIVGIRHTLSKSSGWRTFWSLSSADTVEFAISDVSTSDGPAVAAF